jgi:hypothetical protein
MSEDARQHGLPCWWRRVLVALMTLILCSCQAVVPPAESTDPFADDAPAVFHDRPPRSLQADFVASESRPLKAEELAMPQLAARRATVRPSRPPPAAPAAAERPTPAGRIT